MVGLRRVVPAVLALAAVAFVIAVELHARGVVTLVWKRKALAVFVTERGGAFAAPLGTDHFGADRGPSRAQLWEDGAPLGPANANHDLVRTLGKGSYCYWQDFVLFTASDNTDPRSNGRRYEACCAAGVSAWLRLAALALALGLSAVAFGGPLRRAVQQGRLTRRHAALVLVPTAALAAVAAVALELHARGVLVLAWQRQALSFAFPVQGKAFAVALTGDLLDAHRSGSPARVWEDDRPLAPAGAEMVVAPASPGAYFFGSTHVVFSASDGSDPRTNGRQYEARYPVAVPGWLRPRTPAWLSPPALGWLGLPALVLALAAVSLARRRGWTLVAAVVRDWLPPPIRARVRETLLRLFGSPSFATGAAVFAVVLVVQGANYQLRSRDPDLARTTGMSILGAPYSDAQGWDLCGESIAVGQGMLYYWSANRPGYAIFLGLFYTWLGANHVVGVLLNLVLVALTAALIVRIGETLGQRCAGVLAALAFAAQQTTLDNPLTLGTETLGLFLSVWSLAALCRGLHTGRRGAFLLAGVLFAVSNLTRPLTLPAFPVLLLCIAWPAGRPRQFRASLVRAGVFAAGFAVVLAPWLVRQRLVCGVATLSANSAEAIYAATSPRHGCWTGTVSGEPGPEVQTIRQRYDWYMSRARENLRTDPWFYARNVSSSYADCFRQFAAAARPPLTWLGLALLLALHWRWTAANARRALLGGCALVPLGLVYAWLVEAGAALPLAALVVLPLALRLRTALVFSLGLACSVLGIALFGMRDHTRLGFLLAWAFALAPLAALGACCVGIQAWLGTREPAPVPEEGAVPRWFVLLRWAAALFVLAGAVRLVYLNTTTAIPPNTDCCLSPDQARGVLCELHRQFPGLLRPGDLTHAPLTCLAQSPEEGRNLLVLPCRVSRSPFYLPGGVPIHHFSRYFETGERDRTVVHFQIDGTCYPKSGLVPQPVVFPGFLPREHAGKKAILVCRILPYDAHPTGEIPPFEGVALIPREGADALRVAGAYVAPRDATELVRGAP
jgi:hypothetical protein